MINIDGTLKDLYRNDIIPLVSENAHKTLTLYFPDLDYTITNDKISSESFKLDEAICREDAIRFGSCDVSQVKITVANLDVDLSGHEFILTQTINDTYTMPLGIFKVHSCEKQDNLWFREIIAYDRMKKIDVDVAAWYNSMFPNGNETYALKQFREALLTYLGIECEDETLPNDSMIVTKTIEPTQISGRVVLEATVELNGAFGRINRSGKFERVILLPAYGDYPTDDYPTDDYPVSETDTSYVQPGLIAETISENIRERIIFEDYTVKEIDKLIIRSEEDDIGAIVGDGNNAYVIEGNFLVFGKSAEELNQIAINAFGYMAKRPYRPYTSKNLGLPYLEPGDMIMFDGDTQVAGYMLQRILTGIQALRDEYEAPGSEELEQNFGVNKEIIQLQGKTTRIKKDVEGVRVEVEDLVEETSSKFEQTYNKITQEVTDAKNELSGQIDVLAGQVILKVDSSGNIAAVELGADPSTGTSVKIKADNIELEGYVSINGYTKIKPDGSLEVVNAKISGELVAATGTFSGNLNAVGGTFTGELVAATGTFSGTLSAGVSITSPIINGGSIVGSTFERQNSGIVWTKIDDYGFFQNVTGSLTFQVGYYSQSGYIYSDGNSIQMGASGNAININQFGTFINGSTPITSANISSQNVYSLGGSVYVSANGNLRPFSSGLSSCGTSEGKWSSVWAVNGTIQTSDERKKTNIKPLEEDERFLRFAKMIVPYIYQMIDGTSGRYHTGFIGQRIEDAMIECRISSTEFAGLIKAPVYAEKLKDVNGNELNEYDTTSEIIDYTYHLRYEEFIPLIFLWLRSLEFD